MPKFNLLVCGGTFDHLHDGHKKFLLHALSLGDHLLIGLTSDKYVIHKPLSSTIWGYDRRKKTLIDFFKEKKMLGAISIEPINNLYIPAKWQKLPIEAIVVSESTERGANLINKERVRLGEKPLKVVVTPLVKGTDKKLISSFRIRKGEIDEKGKVYLKEKWLKKPLFLTEYLRTKLAKPAGVIIKDLSSVKLSGSFFATVGDATTKKFNDLGFSQSLSVVDLVVQRKKKFNDIEDLGFNKNVEYFRISNKKSSVYPESFALFSKLFKRQVPFARQVVVQVDGEEDLLVLPLLLTAPLGFKIFYGQRNEGIVELEVTERKKKEIYSILGKMQDEMLL